jgi:hypothetical protein
MADVAGTLPACAGTYRCVFSSIIKTAAPGCMLTLIECCPLVFTGPEIPHGRIAMLQEVLYHHQSALTRFFTYLPAETARYLTV